MSVSHVSVSQSDESQSVSNIVTYQLVKCQSVNQSSVSQSVKCQSVNQSSIFKRQSFFNCQSFLQMSCVRHSKFLCSDASGAQMLRAQFTSAQYICAQFPAAKIPIPRICKKKHLQLRYAKSGIFLSQKK